MERSYGYRALHNHGIALQGARRDTAQLEGRFPGTEQRGGPRAIQEDGVYDIPTFAGQAPEDIRFMQAISSIAV